MVYSADTGHSPGVVHERPRYDVIEPPVVRAVLKYTAKLETSAVMWTEAQRPGESRLDRRQWASASEVPGARSSVAEEEAEVTHD